MYFVLDKILLGFIGSAVYADPAAYWQTLSEAQKQTLLDEGQKQGLSAWFYRFLYPVLDEASRNRFRPDYQAGQARAIASEYGLKRLYRVLSDAGLDFVPIKGADLAYRIYPDAALRSFCDWDIWFHPSDGEKMLAVLKADNWRAPYISSRLKTSGHHYAAHLRGKEMLEPHYTLSRFAGVDPDVLWQYTLISDPGAPHIRRLTSELNLLMLCRHASAGAFRTVPLCRFVADAAFLLKAEKVDFSRLRTLSKEWNLPYPGDLLAVFDEVFPASVLDAFGADPEKVAAYRKLFALRETLNCASREEWGAGELASGGVPWYQQLKQLSLGMLRQKYHLPETGAHFRLGICLVRYLVTKSCRILPLLLRKNSPMREYRKLFEVLESGK